MKTSTLILLSLVLTIISTSCSKFSSGPTDESITGYYEVTSDSLNATLDLRINRQASIIYKYKATVDAATLDTALKEQMREMIAQSLSQTMTLRKAYWQWGMNKETIKVSGTTELSPKEFSYEFTIEPNGDLIQTDGNKLRFRKTR